MTGYLHGLVARANGAPPPGASNARARRPPRFAFAGGPHDPIPAAADRAPAGAGRPPPGSPAAPGDRRRDEDRRPESAIGEPVRAPEVVAIAAPASPAPGAQLPVGTPAQAAAAVVSARAPAPRPGDPAVPRPPHPHRLEVPPDEHDAGSAPHAPITARLRSAPAPPAPPAPPAAPRIEVHIGRVEVRPPVAVQPPGRSRPDTGPDRSAPRGFGELAAARRYVDRLAH